MKRKMFSWQNLLVVLGILVPEGLLFWYADKGTTSIFLLAGLVFGWNFVFLAVRFFAVRFIFDKKEKFWTHVLTMFLTSNYLFFGFGTWIFVDTDSITYRVLPFALLALYAVVWLSQNSVFWEVFTFVALALSMVFSWLLVIPLAFSGGVLAAICLYSVFIAAYNWAKIQELDIHNALFFAALTSLIMSEVSWVLLLWPIHLTSLTVIMLGIFFTFGMLVIRAHHKRLRSHHAVSYLATSLLFFVFLCMTSQWKPPL